MGADQNIDWNSSAASTLDWWKEAGVDVFISEEPRNWLAPPPAKIDQPLNINSAAAMRQGGTPVTVPAPAPAKLPNDLTDYLAWRLGPDAPDAAWPGAALPPEGPADAPFMIAVEMPERDDAAAGSLLSGEAGQLFTRMLGAIGLERGSVHLVPMCTKRPSSGRIPAEAEQQLAAALLHYARLTGPKRILVFGNAVSRAFLGADVVERRGALRPINQEGREETATIQAIASFHPRFLLERPAAKAEAWKDLQLLIQGIGA